jgi:long-chain-fatty-acid--CoA ligase ACSBG
MHEIRSKAGANEYYSKYEAGPEDGANPHVTSDKTTCRVGPMAEKGFAADFKPSTLCDVLKKKMESCGEKPLLRMEDPAKIPETPPAKGESAPPSPPAEEWKTWTYNSFYAESCQAANAFMNLGMKRFDAVTIYGFNHPSWVMSAVGSILGGGICAGIYPTDTADQVKFKTTHSGAVIAVVQDAKKMKMFLDMAKDFPKLAAIVVWSPEAGFESEDQAVSADGLVGGLAEASGLAGSRVIKCMSWDHMIKTYSHEVEGEDNLQARMDAQQPGNCCAYIYTSGTTGNPKAVMISHDNILFEANNAVNHINTSRDYKPGMLKDGDRIISYLPLSHVAGMMVDIICPHFMPEHCCLYFARSYDLKIGTIGERFKAAKPTAFLGVPRVWEKIQEKMMATVAANPPGCFLANCIIGPGKAKNRAHGEACQMGGDGSYACCQKIGDIVSGKAKAALGLDEMTFAFTGAAPIKVETLEYFSNIGININEVYGMSECTGATTWSTDQAHVWGWCGYPLSGEEVAIMDFESDPAGKELPYGEDGEICFRGRHIMLGYMGNPDLGPEHMAEIDKKNNEAITKNGWLRSGDKGKMDTRGMVKITGRYKELIIGAGGENVAPVPVEDGVKARCKAISNVMMVGDQQKYNVALISLKAVGATGDLPGGNDLDPVAKAIAGCDTISAAMDSKQMIDIITQAITDTNKDPKCCPMPPARIQKFTILPLDFSVATDELTPTFKLKRSVAAAKYAAAIEEIYKDENKGPYVKFAGAAAAAEAEAPPAESEPPKTSE